jgi:hypothetical protein
VTSNSDDSHVSSSAQRMSMDAEDDGLHDDKDDGEAEGAAARGASCLNMNPMRMALPAADGAHARDWITRTREMATADHVEHVGPALLAAITAAGGENGRHPARASTLEGQSLCLVCESVIRLANKTSVSTEIKCLRILHAIALVQVCESRVDRGQRGFSALAW